jgi:hypothetical protein
LFCLTNHYLKAGTFFKEYLIARQKLKAIFIILFEPIDSKFNLETIVEMDQLNVMFHVEFACLFQKSFKINKLSFILFCIYE